MAKGFAQAVAAVTKKAHANAARCLCIWAALALREEGYGKERLKRVLENIMKYSKTTLSANDIDEQARHIERVTGLRILWKSDDEITIEEIDDD